MKTKEFMFKDIFYTIPFRDGLQVPTGGMVPSKELKNGNTPRISVTSMNNGIIGHYADIDSKNYRTYNNCISVSFLGTVFYHPYRASFDMKVHCLKPKNHDLKQGEALYLVSHIKKLVCHNTYGNQTSSTELPYMKITLPVTPTGEPDWQFMEDYISELEQEQISELEQYLIATGLNDYELTEEEKPSLDNARWGKFRVGNLFDVMKVSCKLRKEQLSDDFIYPTYSSDTTNNGIIGYTNSPEFICDDNIPCYIVFGDHTRTFNIARKSFSVLDNVKVLKPCKNNSDETIMFILSAWQKQIPNLGYSRHWKIAKDCILSLPIQTDSNNNPIIDPTHKYHPEGYIPDWQFMENYIRAIEKVVVKDVVKYKDDVISKIGCLIIKA